MFYINTSLLRKREVLFLQILPTVVVFLAFFSVTLLSWMASRDAVLKEHTQNLKESNQTIALAINQRMDTYENILRSGTTLFKLSGEINENEWRDFVTAYALEERFPGILGIGFAVINNPLAPDTNRTSRIVFLEPRSTPNRNVIGFDMYAEKNRRAAMDKAAATGEVTLSDAVFLAQDTSLPDPKLGFLMYAPVYNQPFRQPTPESPSDISEIRGFVYAPFRAYEFVENTITNLPDNFSFQLYNSSEDSSQLLYESPDFASLNDNRQARRTTNTIEVGGKTWDVIGVASEDIVGQSIRERPLTVLLGGSAFSLVVAGFIYLLLGSRTRALAQKEERNIQEAKDELLALASHQLRTPATGVKQYVGMLREGFAGSVNPTQQKLLDKAYESNERQLTTINEMLFVARADAGRLKTELNVFDLTELLRNIVDEQTRSIENKQQKIHVQLGSEPIPCTGDEQYLRMAFENLVSNASKYTHEGGSITIKAMLKDAVAVVQVIDNGVGVSQKDSRLLFKKFSRIPNELTNQVSGSGIGLYLTKKVIDSHGGKIVFDSKPGNGTTVTILLPSSSGRRQLKAPESSPRR